MTDFPEYQHKPTKSLNAKERALKNRQFSSIKKKTRLKRVSEKQSDRLKEYNKTQPLNSNPEVCAKCGDRAREERHHPYGRGGEYLFMFVTLCSSCHTWIHENANEAYKLGWIQPEYRGFISQSHPKPWN